MENDRLVVAKRFAVTEKWDQTVPNLQRNRIWKLGRRGKENEDAGRREVCALLFQSVYLPSCASDQDSDGLLHVFLFFIQHIWSVWQTEWSSTQVAVLLHAFVQFSILSCLSVLSAAELELADNWTSMMRSTETNRTIRVLQHNICTISIYQARQKSNAQSYEALLCFSPAATQRYSLSLADPIAQDKDDSKKVTLSTPNWSKCVVGAVVNSEITQIWC